MGAQSLMGTQEPTSTRSPWGIHKSTSIQELTDAKVLMDIQEPVAPNSRWHATVLALLMPPPRPGCPWQQPGCKHQEKIPFMPTPAFILSVTHAPQTPIPAAPHAQRVPSPSTAATGVAESWGGARTKDLARNAHISRHITVRREVTPSLSRHCHSSTPAVVGEGCWCEKRAFWHLLTCAGFG